MKIDTKIKNTCFHCGEKCSNSSIVIEEKYFCCNGCKSVYQILTENNLCTYYNLNEYAGITQKNNFRNDKFAYLDNEEIQQKLIQFKDNKQTHITFFLPQIHCSSCLYLLENIHKINKNIIASKINFAQKEVFVVYNHSKISLRNVVELLTNIGYEPHISLHTTSNGNKNKPSKSKLYKVGIAGFCFANIMLLSLPEYFSGLYFEEQLLKKIFTFLCLGLSLPVVFYAATEFYKSAWNGLKNKYLNIDTPIVLAIFITFFRSIYSVFYLNENGYFDSLCGIVFFMLIGRIAQDKTNQYLSFERDYTSFFPIAINKFFDKIFKPVPIEQLKEGDIIQVFSNEIIPVDAILSKGNAQIDYSFVTGESIPIAKNIGEIIYAGGKQLEGKIELMVVKPMEQSYLINLWNKNNYQTKQTENVFVDNLSKYFSIIIISIGFATFFYWLYIGKILIAFNALTTVLIVACPCTLLLASTFTYGNLLRILAKNKFYIRHPNVLEQLNKIDTIVFDKTGTITENQNIQVSYVGEEPSNYQKNTIISLVKNSNHPYSKAISNFWQDIEIVAIQNFKETIGKGIEAWNNNSYIKIGSPDFFNLENTNNQSIVLVSIDTEIIGQFIFSNIYRKYFANVFAQFKNKYKQYIISGDNESEKQFLSKTLGNTIPLSFNKKPIDKLNFIKQIQNNHQNVLMVGDGLNDAGALKQSNVGIAITENSNNFSPACDAILDAKQFSKLPVFLQFAAKGKSIIYISFLFSFFYNIIGLSFALQGKLLPVIAAILMPISSISIIVLTFGLSQLLAQKFNLLNYDKNHLYN